MQEAGLRALRPTRRESARLEPVPDLMAVPRLAADANVGEVEAQLRDAGCVIVEALAPPELLDRIADELEPYLAATQPGGDDFAGRNTRRTGALIARSPGFRELAAHPLVLGALDRVLADHTTSYQLHLTQVIEIGPAEPAQPVHRDQWAFDFFAFPADFEVECHTMWALSDFTEENGATACSQVVTGGRTGYDLTSPRRSRRRCRAARCCCTSVRCTTAAARTTPTHPGAASTSATHCRGYGKKRTSTSRARPTSRGGSRPSWLGSSATNAARTRSDTSATSATRWKRCTASTTGRRSSVPRPDRERNAVRRVSVVGSSGSGKSTVAARLAEQLGVPHTELDAINHQPNWTPLPPDAFRRRVTEITAAAQWVVDGNYSTVRDIVWDRADTVVWIDLPRGLVARRITMRSIRRVVRREELWNGNRERLRNLLTRDPEESAIRHSWQNHQKNHDRYAAARDDPAFAQLHFVQLRSQREIDAFLTAPRVRDARPDEQGALETIQYEASLVWDEDRPFVLANPGMIVVEPEWVSNGLVRVADTARPASRLLRRSAPRRRGSRARRSLRRARRNAPRHRPAPHGRLDGDGVGRRARRASSSRLTCGPKASTSAAGSFRAASSRLGSATRAGCTSIGRGDRSRAIGNRTWCPSVQFGMRRSAVLLALFLLAACAGSDDDTGGVALEGEVTTPSTITITETTSEEYPGPPHAIVTGSDKRLVLRPWTFCFGGLCADGSPPDEPLDIGTADLVHVQFAEPGWSFTADFSPVGVDCPQSLPATLTREGPNDFLLDPHGPPGDYADHPRGPRGRECRTRR